MVPVSEIIPKKMNEMIHSKTWFIHIGNMYEAKMIKWNYFYFNLDT